MKNTFQLLTDTINHLQKLADELGDLNKFKDAAQPELTRDTGKPKIEGKTYCYIEVDGKIEISNAHFKSDFDNYNCFETREEAETEAAYTLASRKVRAFAKAVNGDWKADFTTHKPKWGVGYEDGNIIVDTYGNYNGFIHQIAFPTEELATKALELFRPEWEILANP